ncbi:MAG TPA: hypothetical protein V6C97_22055 [Oculatellaceae cyanobacterium]
MDYDELLVKPLTALSADELSDAIGRAAAAGLDRAAYAITQSGGSEWKTKKCTVNEYNYYVIQDDDFSLQVLPAHKPYWEDGPDTDPRVLAFISVWDRYMTEE